MIRKQLAIIICLAFIIAPLWAAEQTIIIGETFGTSFGKSNSNDGELYTTVINASVQSALDAKVSDTGTETVGGLKNFNDGISVGLAETTLGNVKWYTNVASNTFSFNIFSSNFTEDHGWRVPTAYPLANGYYITVDTDGTMNYVAPGAGSGDVVGPAAATDGVPVLYDGATGKLIKNSVPTGTGVPVLANTPTLITPELGAATATSIDITKTSGVAGLVSIKESTTTSELYFGIMGPSDITAAESYSVQIPDAQPAGSFLVVATPAGTGDPNGNKVGTGSWVLFPVSIGAAASDETTDLTTGESKVTFRAPFAFTLTEVRANVNTAPTGTGITVDIEEGGTTVLSTLITIDVSEFTSEDAVTPPVISDSAIADDASITIDIDVIGSTIAGKGLKIWLIGTRTL